MEIFKDKCYFGFLLMHRHKSLFVFKKKESLSETTFRANAFQTTSAQTIPITIIVLLLSL